MKYFPTAKPSLEDILPYHQNSSSWRVTGHSNDHQAAISQRPGGSLKAERGAWVSTPGISGI